MDDVVALRAEIDELKQQRQELRQLNLYRETELAKFKEEVKTAQGRVEELSKVVDDMRAREVESNEERKKIAATMLRMVQEQSKVKDENEKNKGLLRDAVQQVGELKRKIEAMEADHRIKLSEKEAKPRIKKNDPVYTSYTDSESDPTPPPPAKRKATATAGPSSAAKKSKT